MDGPTSTSDHSSVSSFNQCNTEVTNMKKLYDLASLGPAMLIVLVLGFLSKRKSFKNQTCSGRPGLVTPVDYFSGHQNRMSIAMAFGATAVDCLRVIIGKYSSSDHTWMKAILALFNVLRVGVINYPFFACLTTEHVIVGSCFGFLYTAARFAVLMVETFKCMSNNTGTIVVGLLVFLPVLVCLVFLLMRFAIILSLRLHKGQNIEQQISFPTSQLATQRNFKYVEKLLFRPERCSELQAPWFIRMRNTIYKPNPDFKFSTRMLSTVCVAIIILYQILVVVVYLAIRVQDFCLHPPRSGFLVGILYIVCKPTYKYSFLVTLVLSTILSFVNIGHMLACHRRHVYLLYHSRKLFFKGEFYSPARLVGRSLSYSGYQIAYIACGFVVVLVSLFIFFFIMAFIVQLGIDDPSKIKDFLRAILLPFLPVIVIAIAIWIFQILLSIFVFRDNSFPNITVTVDNRQVYCIMAYFFFFLNIFVGAFAWLLRILKGCLLGIVFVARIDRTSMREGFYTWDPGYMAYLGHVYFYVAHHHPVLLVFCQLLANRMRNRSDVFLESLGNGETSLIGTSSSRRSAFRISAVGYNRWFLAWTLMKNPGLISQRSKRKRALYRPVSVVGSSVNFSDETLLVG